jgi:hypothetical protein
MARTKEAVLIIYSFKSRKKVFNFVANDNEFILAVARPLINHPFGVK